MEADRWRTIVITAPGDVADEAGQLLCLLEAGITVHIRKPEWDARRVRDLLLCIPPLYHPQLRLHSHFELLEQFPLIGGVHLNSRCPVAPKGVEHISRSCHSLKELEDVDGYDYVFLSPIYDSISKTGYRSHFDLADLAPHLRGKRVVALGGVRPENFCELRQAGFSGAAMLGYVWEGVERDDPECLIDERLAMIAKHRALAADIGLQFITNAPTPEEGVRQAFDAMAGGCRWVQIRFKDNPQAALSAAEMLYYPMENGQCTVVVDDYPEAATLLRCGVHLGRGDMPPTRARTLIGPDHIIGATAHTAGEALEIVRQGAADYIGLGPLRHTDTKRVEAPVLGLEGVRSIIAQVRSAGAHIPIVVIGGVTPRDVPALLEAGAAGVAVSGAIAGAADPVAATREFINALYHN